jgi:hypothetical protein
VAHIRVQCFRARDAQHDGAQDQERVHRLAHEELHRVPGVERAEHGGKAHDLQHAQYGQRGEPEQHDRAKHATDAGGPAPLPHEQQQQHAQGQRNHRRAECIRGHAQALDRGQHAHRRRDHSVAVQERGTEQRQRHEGAQLTRRLALLVLWQLRQERQDAALPFVVRACDDRQVLDADDERDAPKDQRQQAQDIGVRRGHGVRPVHALLQRVQRARADVPVHDAQRAQGQGSLRGGVATGNTDDVRPEGAARLGMHGCSMSLARGGFYAHGRLILLARGGENSAGARHDATQAPSGPKKRARPASQRGIYLNRAAVFCSVSYTPHASGKPIATQENASRTSCPPLLAATGCACGAAMRGRI